MATLVGNKVIFGNGISVASDNAAADIEEWDIEASGVYCEIISVHATAPAVNAFSIQDAANAFLMEGMDVNASSPLNVVYPPGNRPILNGLTVDTPTFLTGLSYSIVYKVQP